MPRHLVPVPATREPLSLVAVQRALNEFRCGRAVAIRGSEGAAVLALAAEATSPELLTDLAARSFGTARIAITARRAAVLGLTPGGIKVVSVAAPQALTAGLARAIADPLAPMPRFDADQVTISEVEAYACETAAVLLAKQARLLPAAAVAPIEDPDARDLDAWAIRHGLLLVDAGDVFQYRSTVARALKVVSEARVPLAGAEDARIIAFRPHDGGIEHLAVALGDPRPPAPVLMRLHSECFTGDLLASLRCDCGDQLRGAISEIAAAGGGLLLYLAQEGRGIGLVNKLRAYDLQDRGFDTLDANEQLGFDADERIYLPAAQILRQLGFSAVRLMTNNPEKVAQLERLGIAVVERVPHHFPDNQHNEVYLRTKAARSGHYL